MSALRWPPSAWGLDALLDRYIGLAVRPSEVPGVLVLQGDLAFIASGARSSAPVEDSFKIELRVDPEFPKHLPEVRELAGRIPRTFHTNPDGTLCLGAPLRLAILHSARRDLLGYVDTCVVPFLFSWIRYESEGTLPFGELAHGGRGLLDEYREIFKVTEDRACIEMMRLLTLKKRVANKWRCPCGSGLRVGRCCHRRLQRLRELRSRAWFRDEHDRLVAAHG